MEVKSLVNVSFPRPFVNCARSIPTMFLAEREERYHNTSNALVSPASL